MKVIEPSSRFYNDLMLMDDSQVDLDIRNALDVVFDAIDEVDVYDGKTVDRTRLKTLANAAYIETLNAGTDD